MVFEIENKVTKKKYAFNVDDIGDSTLYYHFNMAFDEKVDEGEYSYLLYDDDSVLVAQGVAQVGNYVAPSGTTYKPSGTTFIQYQGSI